MRHSDIEIVKKLREDDLKTYEFLFKEYYPELCGYANKYVNEMAIAEEVVQELFYKIWKNRKVLNISISLKAYLYKSIKNNCLQQIQHKKVEKKYEEHLKKSLNGYSNEDPSDVLKMKEIYKIITFTMKELPARSREVFRMNRFDGLKYREIAEKLSISVKTVEANMGVALKLFRKNLKEYTG